MFFVTGKPCASDRSPLRLSLACDPLVKELSLDPKGLRLADRLAEGKRTDRRREGVEAVEVVLITPLAKAA